MADFHSFSVRHAQLYGQEEALMIHCFTWWLKANRANGRNLREGRTWTYNTLPAIAELFPYWTEKQVRRVLKSLLHQGVLLCRQWDIKSGVATNWYAFADEASFLDTTHLPKRADGVPNGQMVCPNGQMGVPDHLPKRADVYKEQLGTTVSDSVAGGRVSETDTQLSETDDDDELQTQERAEQQALQVFRACLPEFSRYYRNPPSGQLKRELLEAVEYHLGEGRAVTPELVGRAVDAAQAEDREANMGKCPRYASRLLPHLAEVLTQPPPKPKWVPPPVPPSVLARIGQPDPDIMDDEKFARMLRLRAERDAAWAARQVS